MNAMYAVMALPLAGLAAGPLVVIAVHRVPGEPGPDDPPAWGPAISRRRDVALLVLTPLLFAASALYFGPGLRAPLFALYAALFLTLAAIDLEHRIVPDVIILPAVILAPVAGLLWGLSPLGIALGGIIHFGFIAVSGIMFSRVLGQEALGMGDFKLAIVLGMLTGFYGVFTSLLASALLSGAVTALLLLLRLRTLHDYIPYAPFMLGGAAIALLLHP